MKLLHDRDPKQKWRMMGRRERRACTTYAIIHNLWGLLHKQSMRKVEKTGVLFQNIYHNLPWNTQSGSISKNKIKENYLTHIFQSYIRFMWLMVCLIPRSCDSRPDTYIKIRLSISSVSILPLYAIFTLSKQKVNIYRIRNWVHKQ